MSTPQSNHAAYKANLDVLMRSGLKFSRKPAACLFREEGKPHVDFYPHTGRWREVGKGAPDKTHTGGAQKFIDWYHRRTTVETTVRGALQAACDTSGALTAMIEKALPAPRPPLSPFRHPLQSRLAPPPPEPATLAGGYMLVEIPRSERVGAAFRASRHEYQLSLGEVAAGWGVPATTISELERGVREFPEAADFKAALDQLWLWHSERRHQGLVSSRGS